MLVLKTYITLLLAALASALPKSLPPRTFLTARNTTTNTTTNTTDLYVYVCQNFDWNPPCLTIPLGPSENNQMNFWMAPAPGGPGPFQNGNYSVGSWGPSQGVTTYWEDNFENKSTPLTYPGTGRVDAYWQNEIWTWYPSWDV